MDEPFDEENHRSGSAEDTIPDAEYIILNQQMSDQYSQCSGRYDLRERRRLTFNYRYGFDGTEGAAMMTMDQSGTLSTPQMSLKQGLLMFGKSGDDAVRKELLQLHEHGVIKPRGKGTLTQV